MAYLGLFSLIFTSCVMSILANNIGTRNLGSNIDTNLVSVSKVEKDGKFFFSTSTTGTGTGSGATTATQITGWETTLIVGVAFAIVFIIWIFLIFGLPSDDVAKIASVPSASGFHQHFHSAPTGFSSGHHAPASHHAAPFDSELHSSYTSYDVHRNLELAARKFQ